jgi:hypothetical protein
MIALMLYSLCSVLLIVYGIRYTVYCHNTVYGMQDTYTVWLQYTVYGIQYTVYGLRSTAYSLVYGLRYTVCIIRYGIRYTVYVYSEQYFGIQYTLYSLLYTFDRIQRAIACSYCRQRN